MAFACRGDLRIAIGGEEHQQRQLLVRTRSHDAPRGEQPYVLGGFAAPEEID